MGICGQSSCRMDHERAHYVLPPAAEAQGDALLYRAGGELFASVRYNSTKKADWPLVTLTDIPNDSSNLNAGALPDGRIYLVHNPVARPKSSAPPWGLRDPVTLSTSRDGLSFTNCHSVMSCSDLVDSASGEVTNCTLRHKGAYKNNGPSYPQALTVVEPAAEELRGLYVAASVNQEDICEWRKWPAPLSSAFAPHNNKGLPCSQGWSASTTPRFRLRAASQGHVE